MTRRRAALGRRVTTFEGFDTFPTPAGLEEVRAASDEVTAVCPVTGQPDWYQIAITYGPTTRCVESKSLKLYFQSFRAQGLFCEALAARICTELAAALSPHWLTVTVDQKARGGVTLKATATFNAGGGA